MSPLLSSPSSVASSTDHAEEVQAGEEPPGASRTLISAPSGSASDDAELLVSPLGSLAGIAIALLSLAVPLASVISDHQEPPSTGLSTSLRR